ncbi:MAG: UrcA family protein [Blastomonas sp.]|nr:UrcA family protein [Blastomonas sp.]
MKTRVLALATLAFALSAGGAAASENPAGENPFARDKAILNLQGLDLSTADGQQRLAIRVDQAARAVCGENLASVHLSANAKAQECRIAVAADVRAQIEQRLARAPSTSATQVAALR